MRWQLVLLFGLLFAPAVLAGCTRPADDDGIPIELEEGDAYVRIFVKKPLGTDQHPIWSLEAVPRLIAFMDPLADDAENNTTAAEERGGYVDVAVGWPRSWNVTEEGAEYPEAAVRNWLQPQSIWFEGPVPAGEYSTVRIEVIEVMGTDTNGRQLEVTLLADRLSVGPEEGDVFVVTAGRAHTFVFESAIERTAAASYAIR